MFDYLPPEHNEQDQGISLGVLLVCLLAGCLLWLGMFKLVEMLYGAPLW